MHMAAAAGRWCERPESLPQYIPASAACRPVARSRVQLAVQRPSAMAKYRPSCLANMTGRQRRCSSMPCISAAPKPPLGRGAAEAAAARVALVRQPSEPAAGTCAAAAVAAVAAAAVRRSCDMHSTARRQRNTSGSSPGDGRRGSPRHRCPHPAGSMRAVLPWHLRTQTLSWHLGI